MSLRKSPRGTRKSGTPAFELQQFEEGPKGQVARIKYLIQEQREKHFARVQKELAHHSEMMARLEVELDKAWNSLLDETRAMVPEPDDVWEIEPTPNGMLSNKALRLTKTSTAKAWDTNAKGSKGWTRGVHEWHARLGAGGNGIGVGICLASMDPTNDTENSGVSFVLNCTSGSAYDSAGEKMACFPAVDAGIGLPANSLVSIRLNLDDHTLMFGINGQWNEGAIFSEVPDDTWYPFFTIGAQNKSVSVAPATQFEEARAQAEMEAVEAGAIEQELAEQSDVSQEEEVVQDGPLFEDDGAGPWTIEPTPNGKLSEDGLSLIKLTEAAGWDTNSKGTKGWTTGVHEWYVKLLVGSAGIGLGICLQDIDQTNDKHNSNLSFVLNCTSGAAYSNSGEKFACFESGFPEGSVVALRLDCDARSLTFGLNGTWLEVPTFVQLPTEYGKFFPFFAVGAQGYSIAIVTDAKFMAASPEEAEAEEAAIADAQLEEDDGDGPWTIEETPNGQLSEDGSVLIKLTEAAGWDTNSKGTKGWTTGVHEWYVKLADGSAGIGLGICLQGIDKVNDKQNSNLSFVLNCTSGAAYSNSGEKFACFESGFPEGSVVALRLDSDAHTLTFGLNGTWIEDPTFNELPTEYGKYSPFFAVGTQNCSVSIVGVEAFNAASPAAEEQEEGEEEAPEAQVDAGVVQEGPLFEDDGDGPWMIEETPNGQLSEDGLVLTKLTEAAGWDTNSKGTKGWTTGLHEWYVKLANGSVGIGLGICLQGIDKVNDKQNSNLSFVLNCTSGAAYSNSGEKFQCFESGLPEGSVVALRLDMDERALVFGLNGIWIEDATFIELPIEYGKYSPFFAVGAQNGSVSIVGPEEFNDAKLDDDDDDEEEIGESEWTILPTPNGTLSNGDLTLQKESAPKAWDCDSHGTVGWSAGSGIHEWHVRLETEGNGVGLGISRNDISFEDDSQNSNLSFILNCTSGAAYADTGDKVPCLKNVPVQGLAAGTVISIRLDAGEDAENDSFKLWFGQFGEFDEDATFEDIPADNWFPFFALGVEGGSVSVLRDAEAIAKRPLGSGNSSPRRRALSSPRALTNQSSGPGSTSPRRATVTDGSVSVVAPPRKPLPPRAKDGAPAGPPGAGRGRGGGIVKRLPTKK